jgi:hypothetical protein
MGADVQRNDRNIDNTDVGRVVHLKDIESAMQLLKGPLQTLRVLSTTPPSAIGSIEQDPIVSIRAALRK